MLTLLLLLQALCFGRVTDKLPHPMRALPKPLPGAIYIDPAFGTRITRVTAAKAGEVIKPMYSTMPAWNADESYLLLWSRLAGHTIYQGTPPYKKLGSLYPYYPTDIEQLLWDPIDPGLIYYPSNFNATPWLIRHDVYKQIRYVEADFSKPPVSCPVGDWSQLLKLGSDPQWMGYGPRKILGLQCGKKKFLYSLADHRVMALMGSTSANAPIVAPFEDFAFLEGYVLDMSFHVIRKLGMKNPNEHGSLGRTADYDVWTQVSFDYPQGTVVAWNLEDGSYKVVVGPSTGYPYPPAGTHLSMIARDAPGWVAFSIVGYHVGDTLLDNEVGLANVVTGQVCRLAHDRTFAGTTSEGIWGYWGEPHVNLSPSGRRLVFGSDWMNSDRVDSFVIDLGGMPAKN